MGTTTATILRKRLPQVDVTLRNIIDDEITKERYNSERAPTRTKHFNRAKNSRPDQQLTKLERSQRPLMVPVQQLLSPYVPQCRAKPRGSRWGRGYSPGDCRSVS